MHDAAVAAFRHRQSRLCEDREHRLVLGENFGFQRDDSPGPGNRGEMLQQLPGEP
jgi:hypothetical protein